MPRKGEAREHALRRGPSEWTAAMLELLGILPDARVAEETGLTEQQVRFKRRALGIAPAARPERAGRRFWTAAELDRLGRDSDRRLARRLGISAVTVQLKRRELSIPPWTPASGEVQWEPEEIQLLGRLTDRPREAHRDLLPDGGGQEAGARHAARAAIDGSKAEAPRPLVGVHHLFNRAC